MLMFFLMQEIYQKLDYETQFTYMVQQPQRYWQLTSHQNALHIHTSLHLNELVPLQPEQQHNPSAVMFP